MAEEFDHDQSPERERSAPEPALAPVGEQAPAVSGGLEVAYPGTLLDGNALDGRGNAPVRAAVIQRMQRSYGNRAVQRMLRVQRSAASAGATSEASIADRIEERAGRGQSLDGSTRSHLESGLGANLSGVRVHTDGEADNLARSVDAVAFTTGSDIFFRSGEYDPGSDRGMHLLAHEATHTVQQSQGPVAGTPQAGGVSVSDPSDQYEQAAEQAAHNVLSGQPAAQSSGTAVQPSVQRHSDDDELPAQTMRASADLSVQRAGENALDEEEEQVPAQTMRASVQRMSDPNYAGPIVGAMQSRGAVVVQRSMAGSFPVPQGIWEMGMVTQEGATKGTGASGLTGSIKFLPGKDSPYSNHIALLQIVKLTDSGGANVNPASLPTSSANDLRTKEDKKAGVEGGFFTDVLHNDFLGTGKDAAKGSNLSSKYPLGPTGGAAVLGFKRSEEAADIKAAELGDAPGTTDATANLDFSFETVAKGTDSLNVYGSVKWAFGVHKGSVVNESGPTVSGAASATFNAAQEKHQDFYVHEPIAFHFLFDSDEMEPGDEAKADTFLDYLKKFPDVKLSLFGFADQRGSIAHNRQLSLLRANKTAQVLIGKGVAADRISSLVGQGKTIGFTNDATTSQDREANRKGNRTVICTFEHVAAPKKAP